MVIKSVEGSGTTQLWAVFDNNGNRIAEGSVEDMVIFFNANKDNIIEDAYSVDGNLVNRERQQIPAIKLNTGWKDLKAKFSVASQGSSAPTVVDLPNGVRIRKFGVNDSMHVEYHVDHDLILSQQAFPHFHVFSDTDVQIGETITWDFIYVSAKGYTQGGNFLAPRTTISLTYTADQVVTAGDHIIIEGSELIESLDLLEPDTQFLCEAKYTGGTITPSGNLDVDAQFSISAGYNLFTDKLLPMDEKLQASNWDVFYLDNEKVRRFAKTNFGVLQDTDLGVDVTGRALYNNGAFPAVVGNGNFVWYFVGISNDIHSEHRVTMFMGQNEFSNANVAKDSVLSEKLIVENSFSIRQEFGLVYGILFQTASSYSNSVQSRIRLIENLAGISGAVLA